MGLREPSRGELETLGQRATRVLENRRERGQRPLIVEFAGSPKSGKSTTIENVAEFLKDSGYRVLSPTEGASRRTPSTLKGDLVAFNVWAGTYALSEVLVAANNPYPDDLVILDRGLFDALCWLWVLCNRGDLDPEFQKRARDYSSAEFDIMREFFLIARWKELIKLVFLFTCHPDKSMERERAGKLSTKEGIAMNHQILRKLLESYDEMEGKYRQAFKEFVRLDTTGPDATQKAIAYAVTSGILDQLEV